MYQDINDGAKKICKKGACMKFYLDPYTWKQMHQLSALEPDYYRKEIVWAREVPFISVLLKKYVSSLTTSHMWE